MKAENLVTVRKNLRQREQQEEKNKTESTLNLKNFLVTLYIRWRSGNDFVSSGSKPSLYIFCPSKPLKSSSSYLLLLNSLFPNWKTCLEFDLWTKLGGSKVLTVLCQFVDCYYLVILNVYIVEYLSILKWTVPLFTGVLLFYMQCPNCGNAFQVFKYGLFETCYWENL